MEKEDKPTWLLEHRETRTWLTWNGELTNDPNDKRLIKSDKLYHLKLYLTPIQSIYFETRGFNPAKDLSVEFAKSIQRKCVSVLKGKGIDLYKEFECTEHFFLP